jgi:hypothetical protein
MQIYQQEELREGEEEIKQITSKFFLIILINISLLTIYLDFSI